MKYLFGKQEIVLDDQLVKTWERVTLDSMCDRVVRLAVSTSMYAGKKT